MKLTLNNNTITNKSGRTIATIKRNKVVIAQKDFKKAVRQIRELLGNNIYFIIC